MSASNLGDEQLDDEPEEKAALGRGAVLLIALMLAFAAAAFLITYLQGRPQEQYFRLAEAIDPNAPDGPNSESENARIVEIAQQQRTQISNIEGELLKAGLPRGDTSANVRLLVDVYLGRQTGPSRFPPEDFPCARINAENSTTIYFERGSTQFDAFDRYMVENWIRDSVARIPSDRKILVSGQADKTQARSTIGISDCTGLQLRDDAKLACGRAQTVRDVLETDARLRGRVEISGNVIAYESDGYKEQCSRRVDISVRTQ